MIIVKEQRVPKIKKVEVDFMLTLAQIKEKAENRMTVAEAKEFEENVGLTLDEFFALANLNPRYRFLAEVLLSDCFEDEDED